MIAGQVGPVPEIRVELGRVRFRFIREPNLNAKRRRDRRRREKRILATLRLALQTRIDRAMADRMSEMPVPPSTRVSRQLASAALLNLVGIVGAEP